MARQIADSIISMRSVDSKDLAQRFVQEFENQPFRGYGASVGEVFHKLKKSKCQDPFKPASEQFNGSGSYGKSRKGPDTVRSLSADWRAKRPSPMIFNPYFLK